jgi:16S rRNA (cytidine1402-2'-O)-methyltransferase
MIYFVSTPIGNLGDITQRALDTLRAADIILSEDTRRTGLLLKHFEIHKPQISFHEHNERACLDRIAGLIDQGKSLALVTDAGTPSICDPGFRLVRQAIDAGWQFTAIPGPSAFVMALAVSGLPVHSFTFRGFLPRKSGARKKFLSADKRSLYTLIYYESPYRIRASLIDMFNVLGDRDAAIANDLTKFYETVHRGTLAKLIALYESIQPKGEYTIVIRGAGDEAQEDCEDTEDQDSGEPEPNDSH